MKRNWLWVGAAALAGGMLRVVSTGNGTLWRDEGMFVFVTRMPSLGAMLDFLHYHEAHAPLFYLVMRGWQAVAGRSEAALAVVPLAAAVALIPLVYAVGARAFSPAAGLMAAWIVALHPALVFHSPQLRPYSLFALFAVGSCWFLWRIAEGAGRRAWAAYVVISLGMLYTHNWGWLILGSQGVLGALLLALRQTRPAWRDVLRIAGAWAVVGLGYLPWLPAFRYQLAHAGHSAGRPGLLHALYQVTDITIGSPQRRLSLALAAGLIVAVLARGLVRRDRPRDPAALRGFVLLTLAPMVVAAFGALIASRTDVLVEHAMSALVPFTALLIGAGLVVLARDWHPALAAVAAGVALGLTGANATRYATWTKSNAAAVAQAVAAQSRPDDVVIIAPEWIASSFNYYFSRPNREIVYPTFGRTVTPEWNDPFARTADLATLAAVKDTIAALHARGARVWMIEERGWAARDVPDVLDLAGPRFAKYGGADLIRAAQVRRYLASVYGPPDTMAVPPDPRRGREMLRAWLFGER